MLTLKCTITSGKVIYEQFLDTQNIDFLLKLYMLKYDCC